MSQGSFSAWIKTLHNSNGGLQWPFYLGAATMGFFLKCPTSFYDRPFGFGSLNCTKTRPLLPKGAGALLCSAPFRPAAEGTSAPLLGGKRTAASIVRKPPFAKWTRSWTTARRLFLFFMDCCTMAFLPPCGSFCRFDPLGRRGWADPSAPGMPIEEIETYGAVSVKKLSKQKGHRCRRPTRYFRSSSSSTVSMTSSSASARASLSSGRSPWN